jgi:hypothetical protein
MPLIPCPASDQREMRRSSRRSAPVDRGGIDRGRGALDGGEECEEVADLGRLV